MRLFKRKKAVDRTLWVTVRKDSVSFHDGSEMPREPHNSWGLLMGFGYSMDRHEFIRWSGLDLRPGTYGLTVQLSVLDKLREVVTTTVTEEKRTKLERP